MFSVSISTAQPVTLWAVSSHVNRPLHFQKAFTARFPTNAEARQVDKFPSLNGLNSPAASPGLVQRASITVDRVLTVQRNVPAEYKAAIAANFGARPISIEQPRVVLGAFRLLRDDLYVD